VQYSQNHEQTAAASKKALERIKAEDLKPSPDIYEVWYTYYAELDPELARAIDAIETSNHQFTNEDCQEFYDRYINDSGQNDRVKEAGDKITDTIQAVGSAVVDVKKATSDYSESLSDVSNQLAGENIDIHQAREVLSNVVSSTQTMIEKNEKLEEELLKSTATMQDLRRDLEQVKKEAMTDGLTGLSNRKSFDSELIRVAAEAAESGEPFSLLMMDIDHFKQFNDSFGHQVGDQVLRLVARTLLDGVKGRDIVARYGGEEFVTIFPQTAIREGFKVADNLRIAVANKEVINRNTGEKLGRITLSGGISEYISGENIEDLIERADAALYAAKHNGRNKVATGSQKA